MGVVQNIVGMVRDVNDRRQAARVDDQLRNYLTDPVSSIKGVMDIAPRTGIALERQRVADEQARTAASRAASDARAARIKNAGLLLRGLPEGADYGEAITQGAPAFRAMGLDDADIAGLHDLAATGVNFAALDDEGWKAILKDRYDTTVATPGAHVLRQGRVIDRVPFAPRTVTTRGGDGSSRTDVFDPTTMTWNPEPRSADVGYDAGDPGDGGGPLDVAPPDELSNDEGGAILQGALANKVIGRSQAQAVRASMGQGGGAAFNQWLQRNGITVVDDRVAALAPPAAPTGPGQPARVAGPAPQTAQQAGRAPITMPGKPAERYRPATAAELQGYPAGTAAQVNVATGELENVHTPPAATLPKPMTPAQRMQITNQQNAIPVIEAGWQRIEDAARAILANPSLSSATGAVQGRLPTWLPGPDWQGRQDVVNAVESLKSQITINTIKEMREASKTGGALGNVSDRDMATLEAALGSLAFTQSDAAFRDTLREIINVSEAAPQRARDAVQLMMDNMGFSEEAAAEQPQVQIGSIARNAQGQRVRFKGGDSANPDNWEPVR